MAFCGLHLHADGFTQTGLTISSLTSQDTVAPFLSSKHHRVMREIDVVTFVQRIATPSLLSFES